MLIISENQKFYAKKKILIFSEIIAELKSVSVYGID